MSIGENTLLLKRGCLNCNGFDFCGSVCITCAKTSENVKTTLPISIKACQSAQPKAALSHFSLSSSLSIASPPPIFTLLEEEQSNFKVRQAAASKQAASSPGQMAINEHLFKEYRDPSSTACLSSSTCVGEDQDNEDDDDDNDDESGSESDFSNESSDYPSNWCFEDYFAQLPGNDWCVRIPAAFIHDEFNLFEFPDVFRCPLRLSDEKRNGERWYTDDYGFDDLLELITTDDLECKFHWSVKA